MSGRRKVLIWAAVIMALMAVGGTVAMRRLMHRNSRPVSLMGAVVSQNGDTKKELPIAGVQIIAVSGTLAGDCKSDSSGFFSLTLSPEVVPGQSVTLRFRHPEYLPLDLNEPADDKLYVARMVPRPPRPPQSPTQSTGSQVRVANVSARYSIKATTAVNIGSAVKTFQVINTGNVPCEGQRPCSPDGKWKAAIGSASLDAGEGNEFRNARVSCIAGPCPFTRIESDGFSRGGRTITVSARNWSDTTTFLLEAEVFHPMVSDNIRRSYPVIFGRALNFTLPAAAEGVSIQAEINGETIVFPLGPNLFLSWANCNERVNNDHTKVYRCELKAGYQFPDSSV
jgi:hypothetical protein